MTLPSGSTARPDLLAAYAGHSAGLRSPTGDVAWDELVERTGSVRTSWRGLGAVLDLLGEEGLHERRETVARLLQDDGATYRAQGSEDEQPWVLDPIPALMDEPQWAALEPALTQRAQLLDLVLADLYGPRTLLSRGLLPPEVLLGHPGFVRAVDQVRLPGPHQLFLAAADLGRDTDGSWRVLSDRTQAPSGAGYAMENRRAVSRAMPGLHRSTNIHRIGPFFHAMRVALQQLAPTTHEVPRVVLLTPGAHSETAFDQAFLSSLLGFPLVEGADLVVRDGRVWQRSIGRLEPVDVILRRVDSWFCDPLELRPDSRLGVPGLVEAARLGTVSIVNGLGAGALENPALFPFLPALSLALLDEPLKLHSVHTWWCHDPAARQHVLSHLDDLVVKPTARHVGHGSQFGWELSRAQREDLRRRIEAEPHAWVAQQPLSLSVAPTVAETGLEPRPMLLRTFALAAGTGYRIMPGGLARAAATPHELVVTNQQGAVSKDVWVLSPTAAPAEQDVVRAGSGPHPVNVAISPRVAEDLFWLGRYAERAEDVSRLLRIADNRWHDVTPTADPVLSRCLVVLLEALTSVTGSWPGFLGAGASSRLAAPRDELMALIGDEQRIGSVAHDLRRTRELANAVRDQLSNDTWLVLSRLDRRLVPYRRGWATSDDVSATVSGILESLLAFSGLAAESMVRDTGWYLLDAGRRIERAMQVLELLRATLVTEHPPAVETMVMESVLIAAESVITHRRRYPARAGVETVLELLLTDGGNPRSLANQLDRLAHDLAQIAASSGVDDPLGHTVLTIIARVREADEAALVRAEDGRRPLLNALLVDTHRELASLALAITARHFVQPAPLQPLEPFTVLAGQFS